TRWLPVVLQRWNLHSFQRFEDQRHAFWRAQHEALVHSSFFKSHAVFLQRGFFMEKNGNDSVSADFGLHCRAGSLHRGSSSTNTEKTRRKVSRRTASPEPPQRFSKVFGDHERRSEPGTR